MDGTQGAQSACSLIVNACWPYGRQAVFACLIAVLTGSVLTGCSGSRSAFKGKGSPIYKKSGPIPEGGGVYKVGNPYQIAGRWYRPKEEPDYDKTGMASWYGPKFHKRMTANGEWFDMNRVSAAHPTLPLPSYVRVTNRKNGKSVVVRVNDRGPYAHDRIIDLSKKSAELLGFTRAGTAPVRVTYLRPAPLDGDDPRIAAQIKGGKVQFAKDESDRPPPTPVRVARAPRERENQRRKVLTPAYESASLEAGTSLAANEAPAPDSFVEPGRPAAPAYTAASTAAPILPDMPAAGTGSIYVQAAAYSDPHNAELARQRLQAIGNVRVASLRVGNTVYHRVQVGPFADTGSAQSTIDQIASAGFRDARLSSP